MNARDEVAELRIEVAELRQLIERLQRSESRLFDDPMIKSMIDGTRRIPFPTRWRSPITTDSNYILIRLAGGHAAFVPSPASPSDWSDA